MFLLSGEPSQDILISTYQKKHPIMNSVALYNSMHTRLLSKRGAQNPRWVWVLAPPLTGCVAWSKLLWLMLWSNLFSGHPPLLPVGYWKAETHILRTVMQLAFQRWVRGTCARFERQNWSRGHLPPPFWFPWLVPKAAAVFPWMYSLILGAVRQLQRQKGLRLCSPYPWSE